MKNPFEKDDHTTLIVVASILTVAALAASFLFLTDKGENSRKSIKKQLKKVAQQEATAQVSVRDFGIGIGQKHLGRLFDRFYRVDDLKERKFGLGVGLYICREIIERHHGSIRVESTLGEGSIFIFELPLTPSRERSE